MELQGYAPKDAKIIRENEGKTPYELLELGLSQKAFDRLTADQDAQKQAPAASHNSPSAINAARQDPKAAEQQAKSESVQDGPIQPAAVEQVSAKQPQQPAAPVVNKPVLSGQPKAPASSPLSSILQQATVVGPTGIPQKMNAKQAAKLVERNPGKFQIVV